MTVKELPGNTVVPVNLSADNIITATSGPGNQFVSIQIDADLLTLGIVARVLKERYEQHLKIYRRNGLVPDNMDEMVEDAVKDYFSCGRTGITMIRKDEKNGQN